MTREIEEHEQTGSVLGAILCFDTCCLRFYLRIFLLRMWRFSSDLHLEKAELRPLRPRFCLQTTLLTTLQKVVKIVT